MTDYPSLRIRHDDSQTYAGWVRQVVALTAAAGGVNEKHVLDAVGLRVAQLDSGRDIPQSRLTALWRYAEKLSGRPDVGLEVLEHFHIAALGPLAYALLTADTFGQAAREFIRHASLISKAWRFALLDQAPGYARITIDSDSKLAVSHHSFDAIIAAAVRFTRDWLSGGRVLFDEIWFRHPDFGVAARYQQRLGCRCRFDAPEYALLLDASLLSEPMPAADHDLHRTLYHQLLAQGTKPEQFSRHVERLIREALQEGRPSHRAAIAACLGLGERTMLRRLRSESTTYASLSQRAKEAYATELLASGATLSQIAEKMGYSDAASVSKALLRWTGTSARVLRQRSSRKCP